MRVRKNQTVFFKGQLHIELDRGDLGGKWLPVSEAASRDLPSANWRAGEAGGVVQLLSESLRNRRGVSVLSLRPRAWELGATGVRGVQSLGTRFPCPTQFTGGGVRRGGRRSGEKNMPPFCWIWAFRGLANAHLHQSELPFLTLPIQTLISSPNPHRDPEIMFCQLCGHPLAQAS